MPEDKKIEMTAEILIGDVIDLLIADKKQAEAEGEPTLMLEATIAFCRLAKSCLQTKLGKVNKKAVIHNTPGILINWIKRFRSEEKNGGGK